jgi:hypothetical protein
MRDDDFNHSNVTKRLQALRKKKTNSTNEYLEKLTIHKSTQEIDQLLMSFVDHHQVE